MPPSADLFDPCHTKLYRAKPWLIALVQVLFILALKANSHAPACSSENHDNDCSLMPPQEARSDDYAPETLSSEEF